VNPANDPIADTSRAHAPVGFAVGSFAPSRLAHMADDQIVPSIWTFRCR
jgi:hypothetical protein